MARHSRVTWDYKPIRCSSATSALASRPLSFDSGDDFAQAHVEGLGDGADRGPRWVRLAQLQARQGAGGRSRADGERFLGQAALLAQLAQHGAKRRIAR